MKNLLILALQNLSRNRKHNLLSSIGVIIGIATFCFFLALDAGVRKVVFGEIFPVEQIEIVAAKASFLGANRKLNIDAIDEIRKRTGANVYAKMKMLFPARGWGGKEILGKDFYFEVGGFCEGINSEAFKDKYELFVYEEPINAPPCKNNEKRCDSDRYCAWDINRCLKPVPVILSRRMIEMYNGSIAPSNPSLPKIPDFATSLFWGRRFTVELGKSYLGTKAKRGGPSVQRIFRLVGVSSKTTFLGLTIPLDYLIAWNKRYGDGDASKNYSSLLLRVKDKAKITAMGSIIRKLGFDIASSFGEVVGIFITVATLLFTLISTIIMVISAINIAHTFMMLTVERKKEIGILRAIGAAKWQIRALILIEASILGIFSGIFGVGMAGFAAFSADYFSSQHVADFPFKPASYFSFSPGLVVAAIGFAILFCLLGAFIPALKATRDEPAQAFNS